MAWKRRSPLEVNTAVLTHEQVMRQHIQRLLETEQLLVAEARRVECGLATVRRQIAVEREALGVHSQDRPSPSGRLAA